MNENEIMDVNEVEELTEDIMVNKESGMGTGLAMAVGAMLTVAVGAAVKYGKKVYANYKAKKELRKPDHEVIVDAEDIEEVTE